MSTHAEIGTCSLMRCKGKDIWLHGKFFTVTSFLLRKNAKETNVSLQLLPKEASRVLLHPFFLYSSLETVIRFQAQPRLPIWSPTAVEAGHVVMKVNDLDFLDRPEIVFKRTTVPAFGLWLLYSILRSQRNSLQGWEFSCCTELCYLSQRAVPNNRPSSM